MKLATAKSPTVHHTRYTVKGAKLGSLKSPKLKGLKSAVSFKGLKAGKKVKSSVKNPLAMKANY